MTKSTPIPDDCREQFREEGYFILEDAIAQDHLQILRDSCDRLMGVVIKSHGGADSVAFQNAVRTALVEAQKGVPTQIGELLEKQATLEQEN